MLSDYLASSATDVQSIVDAVHVREKESLLKELVIPVAGAGTYVVSSTCYSAIVRLLKRRAPRVVAKILAATATNATIGVAAGGATGPAAPVTGSGVFAVTEVAALVTLLASEMSDVVTLICNYPTPDEATRWLPPPSAVLYEAANSAVDDEINSFAHVTQRDVALTVTYVINCSALPIEDVRKLTTVRALIGAWFTGYAPQSLRPLISTARKRLNPYAIAEEQAYLARFKHFLSLIVKRGSSAWALRARRALGAAKIVNIASTFYNAVVVTDNAVASVCRTIGVDRCVAVTADYVVDFLLSPSSYSLRWPFEANENSGSQNGPEPFSSSLSNLEASGAREKMLIINQRAGQLDAMVEEY